MEPAVSSVAITCTPSSGLHTSVSDTPKPGLFASFLKAEGSTNTHSMGSVFPSHEIGSKEKFSAFGKPQLFSFPCAAGVPAAEFASAFPVKNISIALSGPPSTTAVTVPSTQCSAFAKSSTISSQVPASDSVVTPFMNSVFSVPKESAGTLFPAPKVPTTKEEKSFSFAETLKKETVDKSLHVEPQSEEPSTGLFGRSPAFSFTSAAANIMLGKKVFGQSSSNTIVSHRPIDTLVSPSTTQDGEQFTCETESKASPRKASSKGSRMMTSYKTSPGMTSGKNSPRMGAVRISPRITVAKTSPGPTHSKISPTVTSSKASPEVSNSKTSSDVTSRTVLPRRFPSDQLYHPPKDPGSSLLKKKYRREFSVPKTKKKSKDEETKADIRSSGLATSEEIRKLTSVICKGIPPDLNHKNELIKHFSQFGQVKKLSCNTRHNHAIITFSTHEAAKKAKKMGCVISPNFKPAEIFWYTHVSKSSDEKRASLQSEVHEELQSMMEIVEHDVLNRPAEYQSPPPILRISTSPKKLNEKPKSASKDDKPKFVPRIEKSKSDSWTEKSKSDSRPDKSKSDSWTEKPKSDLKDSKHFEKVKSRKSTDSNEDSLKKMLEMPALTEADKYNVLNVRDKLMRMNMQRQSDISKAKAIAGTCPDICSEKERYSRFEKKGLSVYEQKKTFDPSITVKCLDHRLIVKEYSRSSADKEEPLPHEIRPAYVLKLTMDHLMCNVANKVVDSSLSVGEWYDFIWNRTRAIRKDVAQQDLCNLDCVQLVEKCVRFHIHCAAVLCEEDIAVFDPKINDENLTKSLQTLKHMYHDLAINGIVCSNEAEFRAYDILLSLNEGDTLRQAQNFSSDIRASSEVRFAVCAALALNSNNYIRFFKLVGEASYLSACIMHRYFTPVRERALHAMLKAYCIPNHVEMYPLEELVRVLKFENTTEAAQFCQWLGFQTDENYLKLDRTVSLIHSSSSFVVRSIIVVEKKRRVTVGEVMNKGPLPVNPLISYEPHCSFDCDGYLKKEAYDASDQKLKAEQCNKTVKITVIQSKPVFEEVKVEMVTKPIVKECKVSDVFPVQESASNNFFVPSTIQLQTRPAGQTAQLQLPKESDRKGFFINTSLSTADEKKTSKSQALLQPFTTVQEPVRPTPPSSGRQNVEVMQYASNIWKELSSEVLQSYAHEVAAHELQKETMCIKRRDSLINEVLKDMCFEVSCDVIKEVVQEELRAYETGRQKEECVSCLSEEILCEVVQEHVSQFVEQSYMETKKKMLDAVCNSLMKSFLENCVNGIVKSVAEEVYSQEMKAWKDLIAEAKRKTQLRYAKKALVKWRRAHMKRKRLELLRETFPCSHLIPLKRDSFHCDCENMLSCVKKEEHLLKLLDAGVLLSSIQQELSWHPLDLTGLFEKCFPMLEATHSPYPKKICWKLLLLVPESYSAGSSSSSNDNKWKTFTRWFCAKFHREKFENAFENSVILCDLFGKSNHGYHVDICVRAVLLGSKEFSRNLEEMKMKGLLEGTSAIFLLMPCQNVNDLVHKEILTQVKLVLDVKHPVPPVPLYCFLVGSKVCDALSVIQVLNSLKENSILCDYKVSSVEDITQYWDLSGKLSEAMAWLLEKYNEVPTLINCSLKDFVEGCFLKIFSVIYEDLSHSSPAKVQNPTKMINFHNSILLDFAEVVCSPSLSKISWPPPEMVTCAHVSGAAPGWNELENLNKIQAILASIHLPKFHGAAVHLDDLWTYVEEVANVGGSSSCNLFSSINSFLLKNEQFVTSSNFIPWSDVIYDCSHYLMSCQSFMSESTEKELQVTYVFEDLQCLDLKSKWKHISGGNEVMFDENSVRKRKYCEEEMFRSSVPEDAHLSHVVEHSHVQVKFARSEKEDGMTYEQPFMEDKMQYDARSPFQLQSNTSIHNFSVPFVERDSFEFMEAIAVERRETDSYLSLLEAKVAEGEWINNDTLGTTFPEEDYDEAIAAHSSTSSRKISGHSSVAAFSEPRLSPVNLNRSLEDLKDSIASHRKANETFERRLRQCI